MGSLKNRNQQLSAARNTTHVSRLTACRQDATVFYHFHSGGAVAQLGARLDGIEEVGGSNPPGSTNRKP
jgi:hypothetical protein